MKGRSGKDGVDDAFHFHRFIFPGLDHPSRSQDLAPFPYWEWLLALLRACLSALLYKSIGKMCLLDFDTTNLEPEKLLSKRRQKKIMAKHRTSVRRIV
jgi:hypothetical protein